MVPDVGRRVALTFGGENLHRSKATVVGVVEDARANGSITVVLDKPQKINREEVKRIIATREVILGWAYEED